MNAENIKHKLDEFDNRFDIADADTSKGEFIKFKTRVLNAIKGIDNVVTNDSISKFCLIFGISEEWSEDGDDNDISYNIIGYLEYVTDEKDFYKALQTLFYLDYLAEIGFPSKLVTFGKSELFKEISNAISFSKINLGISKDAKGNYILHPKGEKELDDKLIDKVLSFLNPESNILFVEGLKLYLEGTDRSFIDAVDKMRRTLEEFLRFKLGNAKGLAANITELNKIHKAEGKDKKIRDIISTVFSYLDNYFDENAKHNDGDINDNECEYIIYQTGVLLRYVDKLNISN